MEHREIVACDYCNLSWHLDCVDPPLAATPVRRSNNGRPRSTWMCPNHVETELSTIDVSALKSSNQVKSGSGRSYKVRRPKKVTIVDTALRRGFKNNGLIEIEDELSEEETKIADHDERGRVIYRVPAKGLKLDFIDRVKRWVL